MSGSNTEKKNTVHSRKRDSLGTAWDKL